MQKILNYILLSLTILLLMFVAFETQLRALPVWMQVGGRLHPAILHFPIVMLFVVVGLEVWQQSRKEDVTLEVLLAFGWVKAAIITTLTAILGIWLYSSGGYDAVPEMAWHKWTGVGMALVLTSFYVVKNWLKAKTGKGFLALLGALVVVMIATGHWGASVTHGTDYLTEPLKDKNVKKQIRDINKAVVFSDLIQPILQDKCVSCHNPSKAKGGLVMLTPETLMKGGEHGKVIIPFKADSSKLYTYTQLPLNDKKHMPPEGKSQLDEAEVQLLHWWISSGANYQKNVAQLSAPDSIRALLNSRYRVENPLDELNLPFASADDIQKLNTLQRGVRQSALSKPYVEVFMSYRKDLKAAELSELSPLKTQITSLYLSYSNVTDEVLQEVQNFPHLQRLHLEGTPVTDAQIEKLKGLRHLTYLNLTGTKITNQITQILPQFPTLDKVALYNTPANPSHLAAFMQKNKRLKLDFARDIVADTMFKAVLTDPKIKIDSTIFAKYATLEMKYKMGNVALRYTLDGTEPTANSPQYTSPLKLYSSGQIRVKAMKEGWKSSEIKDYFVAKATYLPTSYQFTEAPDPRYPGVGAETLFNREFGTSNFREKKHIGNEGKDLGVSFQMARPTALKKLGVNYLIAHGSFILSPAAIEVYVADQSNGTYQKIATKNITENALVNGIKEMNIAYIDLPQNRTYQYMKVRIVNRKTNPAWHPAKGQKSWAFVDEILLE